MNTKQKQIFYLLLCLQRLIYIHNPNIVNSPINTRKNLKLYIGAIGLKNTISNIIQISYYLINKYNIKELKSYIHSTQIQKGYNFIMANISQNWLTYIFNPITPREYERGIYTLKVKIPTNILNSFIIGFSNKKIPKFNSIYYYYLSYNTQYLSLNLSPIHNSSDLNICLVNNNQKSNTSQRYALIKINKKLDTNDTFTFDIFNRDKINPPKEIKNQYKDYGENWNSTGSKPIIIPNKPFTTVKIIYHSYDHTIKYYINKTLLCTIPAEIDKNNMYPFICLTSHLDKCKIDFL